MLDSRKRISIDLGQAKSHVIAITMLKMSRVKRPSMTVSCPQCARCFDRINNGTFCAASVDYNPRSIGRVRRII